MTTTLKVITRFRKGEKNICFCKNFFLWTCLRRDDIHSSRSKYTLYAIIISFLSVELWKKRILVFGQFALCFLWSACAFDSMSMLVSMLCPARQRGVWLSIAFSSSRVVSFSLFLFLVLFSSFSYSLSEFVLHCFGNMVQGMDVEGRKIRTSPTFKMLLI